MPRHWLVMRLSAMGDVVLLSGVLEYWRNKYGCSFTLFTRKNLAPLLENHPAVTGFVTPGPEDLKLPRLFAYFRSLAEEHAGSGLLDLHGTTRSRLLACSWKGPVRRYPKLSLERRAFLRSKGRFCRSTLLEHNVTQRYALALEPEAPPADLLRPRIFITGAEERKAERALNELFGHIPTRLVALHPFATHRLKAWPAEYWRSLAEKLDKLELPWLAFGQGDPLFSGNPRDLTNRTSLREMCALLARCSLLVTGDSGPMHLASGVDVPVLALFGPTTKEWGFFPSGPHDLVLESGLPCRPCSLHGGKNCPRGGECMSSITPEDVLNGIKKLL